VSVSQDKSAIVWDYHTGRALRTYLLPDTPVAVTLDPADRAFYVAYEDGSFQTISFYDDYQQGTPADTIRDPSLSHRPIQPSPNTRFNAESQKLGGALSISLSWDGTTLISGHASGKIAVWDIAKGNYISTLTPLPGPVTNLQFLEPTGFPTALEAKNKLHTVVKPRKDLGTISGSGIVPPNYSLSMQFTGGLDLPSISATERRTDGMSGFNEALTHSSFPLSMLEESLCELETWTAQLNSSIAPAAEFLPVTGTEEDATGPINNTGLAPDTTKDTEIAELKKQLASLQRIQKVTFTQLSELREEKQYFLAKERERAVQEQSQTKHNPGLANGSADADGDVDMSEGSASESAASESNDDDESDEDEEEDKGAESE
jgi:pre-rRNA-processing protein IPI3